MLAIRKALNADPVDIASLRQLAISRGGLINDELRLRAWPKLLNVNVFNIGIKPSKAGVFSINIVVVGVWNFVFRHFFCHTVAKSCH